MTPLSLPLAELKAGLTGLGKIVNSRSALPVLQSLRIERTPDGWVCLTATDLDHFVTLRLEQPAKGEPFAMLVPFDELARLTKSSGKDERLELEPGDTRTVLIRFSLGSQTGQTQVQSLPVEEFPVVPKLVTGKDFPVAEELRTALQEAFACCGSDVTRPALLGALLDVTGRKGHSVVATDGRHLYTCNSFRLPFPQPIIIPKHQFLAWREFNLDGPWQMKVGGGHADGKGPPLVQLSSRRWRFVTRQLEGPFPQWRRVIPEQKPATVIGFKPSQLQSLIQTIEWLPCHDEHYRSIRLDRRDQEVWLLAKAQPADPWTPVPIEIHRTEGRDVTVLMDRLLLIKALQFGLSTLSIIDATAPLRFSGGGRQLIVMPQRGDSVGSGVARPAVPASRPKAAAAPTPSSTAPHLAGPNPTPPMQQNDPTTSTPDSAHGTQPSVPAGRPTLEAAFARLESLKTGFRQAMAEVNHLSDIIKQAMRDQRISQRETHTMRSLQSLRI